MSKVFFANSGSEANDSAIKMVWYYNNARGLHAKKKLIGRIKGYHGITIASASLTRVALQPQILRPAAARLPAYDDAAFLPRRAARRDRG